MTTLEQQFILIEAKGGMKLAELWEHNPTQSPENAALRITILREWFGRIMTQLAKGLDNE